MERKLTFTQSDERDCTRFKIIVHGFIAGGNTPQPKTFEIQRREKRILDKLDAIGRVEMNGNADFKVTLLQQTADLVLDQPEYELVRRYIEAAPWTTMASRPVIDTVDWMASVPAE